MKRVLIFLTLCLFLAPVCKAQDAGLWDALGIDELSRAGEEYGVAVPLTADLAFDQGISTLLEQATEYMPDILRAGIRSGLLLLVIAMLCAMAESLQAAGVESKGLNVCVLAGTLAVAAVSVGETSAMMGLGRSTIDRMQGFSEVLLPITAACTATMGAPAGAAARQIVTSLFSNGLITLIDRLLVPAVYAYIAVCSVCAAVGNSGLKKVAAFLKWIVTKSLTALLVLFVTYLTVSGAIAGTTDAAALKVAKMTISAAVPVVGGIISNAAGTILVGAGVLKNTVGVFGMLAVLGICVVPFLKLGAHYLTYKITGALTSTLADSRLAELIDNIGTAFALMLGMTGASALLLLVSMMSAIGTGGSG